MSRSFFWSCVAFLVVVLFFFALTGLSLASKTVYLDLSPQAEEYFSSVISIFAGVVCGFAAIMTWGSWR